MNPILNKNLYFIKEKTGIFKAANSYDILDPETSKVLMTSTEPNLGFFTKIVRFTKYKSMTPFNVVLSTTSNHNVVNLKRGVTIFRSDVQVFDDKDRQIGIFKQKFWSMGGKFEVYDMQGKQVCLVEGKWTGWDFKFTRDNQEIAIVTKKWAGLGKELFTSADNYILEIKNTVPQDDIVRQFIMAAVLCIDMVLKER
ncbi:phospholipid scramblase-related protein [Flavobacterium sp.]|uniref:phospholipid scramblase-related protein n=1 Tax=Flavobacterium sp. TaxID=239 RepID=UPI00286E8339|nr:phospholipid scramblase-related protein [Flavobacterium sp.]